VNPYASALAVTLAFVAVGCRSSGQTATGKALSSPPAPVEQAEALAEDVQTDLAQNGWPAAEAKLRELNSLKPQLDAAGVPQSNQSAYGRAVDSLQGAINRRSRSDALTAGNHVSRIVSGIMADYTTKVPTEVTYMDVAGRDVLYAAEEGRWIGATGPMAEVGKSYAAVQAHVTARNPALDQRITSEIAQLQGAVDSQARDRATRLAQALLDDVDHIEQTF
jgi:hypothetical protein